MKNRLVFLIAKLCAVRIGLLARFFELRQYFIFLFGTMKNVFIWYDGFYQHFSLYQIKKHNFDEIQKNRANSPESGSQVGSNPVKISGKKIFFAFPRIFSVLNGVSSVFSRDMDTTRSQLHPGSGFLKND